MEGKGRGRNNYYRERERARVMRNDRLRSEAGVELLWLWLSQENLRRYNKIVPKSQFKYEPVYTRGSQDLLPILTHSEPIY